jgi:predicted dehydrogenase
VAKKLRGVLVGCGGISDAWLGTLAVLPTVELVGLVDLNLAAAQARKDKHGLAAAQTGDDLRAMLRAVRPDVVFDCTVPEAHTGVTLAALRHGCHVLGEKPLADSMEHAARMVKAAAKAGRVYAVMQNRRYNPRIRGFSRFLARGGIGELTTLYSDFFIGAHFGGFRDRMRHVLLLDMAIHTFDAARFVSGADPVAVYCREWNPKGSWYDHDASAIAVFEMSNGIVYSYRGSWCADGLGTKWECDWRAIGTRGTALWDGADGFRAQAVTKQGGFVSAMKDVAVPVPQRGKQGGHGGCIRDFIACIRAGRVPETVCTDNIKSLAMVFAAIESAESGERVKVRV